MANNASSQQKISVAPRFSSFSESSILSSTFESSFRKFHITRINPTVDNSSIIEHVQVSVPWLFDEQYEVNEFVIKTFADFVSYDNENSAYLTLRDLKGIPKLYKKQKTHEYALVLEYTGKACRGHQFTFADAIKVCTIVNNIHKKKMVHNDLKQSNITLKFNPETQETEFFIIDFEFTSNTDTESAFGYTDGYIAPERCTANGNCCYNSDIYSLGITFATSVRFL